MTQARSIGRYRLERRLGSGAFATVWLAHDDLLDSPVAVKVLADNWSERLDIRDRFLTEARILRRADSDYVVRVHDIGELDDGRPYFVMTYANGGTLADRLAAGPLPVDIALRHARGIADGLAVLHKLEVVHRDVKPSNILYDRHGESGTERVLIADLGLARAVAHSSGFTLAAGTPGYMAPEQAMGGAVDARADVYAIGAVIEHMLTGVQPRTVTDRRSADLARADADALPGALGDVARRALAVEPAYRFSSAVELAAALSVVRLSPVGGSRSEPTTTRMDPVDAVPATRPAPSSVPSSAPPPSPSPPARPIRSHPLSEIPNEPSGPNPRLRRRRPGLVGLAIVVVLLVALGGGGYAYYDRYYSPTRTVRADGLSVSVPRSWATHYQQGSNRVQALTVSSDVAAFDRSDDPTPGVFVRTYPAGTPVSQVRTSHPGCSKGRSRNSSPAGWDALYWGCGSAGTSFYEATRTVGGRLVYAQIKQQANATEAMPAILSSISVG